VLPQAGAKGICLAAGYVPSGAGAGAPATNDQTQTTTPDKKPLTAPLVVVKAPAGPGAKAAVSAMGINVREKPALAGKVMGGFKRGTVLDVTGKSADGKWFQIKYKTGPAWVFASLTVPNDAAKAVAVAK
jgi:uncharacterized protein YgiM (DUF1202 family)